MTKDELYQLVGHHDIFQELDVKTLVLDTIREKFSPEELQELLWRHLDEMNEEQVRGYFYRRF